MLRNIMKNVTNVLPAINMQNVANGSCAFPLFSFFAIMNYVLIVSGEYEQFIEGLLSFIRAYVRFT